MKIKLSFLPAERERVSEAVKALERVLAGDGPRISRSDRHPPYRHIYIVTKKQHPPQ